MRSRTPHALPCDPTDPGSSPGCAQGSSTRPAPPARARVRAVLALAVVAVSVAARVSAHRGTPILNLDDPQYLSGTGLLAATSPLYSAWCRMFAALPSPLHASWATLLTLDVALFGAALLVARVRLVPAAVACALLPWIHVVEVEPHVALLASALVLAGIVAASRFGLSALATAFAASAFVRPELVLGFGLALAVAARKERARAVVPAAAFVALALGFGWPVRSERDAWAFGQHYALNVALASGADPTAAFDAWQPAVRRDFDGTPSVLGAAIERPGRFLWHVGQNVRHAPLVGTMFAPPGARPLARWAAEAVLAIVAVIGILRLLVLRDTATVAACCAFLPAAIASLAYHPRVHYAIPTALVALASGVAALAALLERGPAAVPHSGASRPPRGRAGRWRAACLERAHGEQARR